MSKETPGLKKKLTRHLELSIIIEHFKKNVPACGIAALYLEKAVLAKHSSKKRKIINSIYFFSFQKYA